MSKAHPLSGFAPVHRGELYYEVAGEGRPLLLIHAGVADCAMWDSQFDQFSQNYRTIRYDTRGYGKSRTKNTSFSNRQDILDLFNHLGVVDACILGISRGGQIAIDFTVEHPERVSALIPVAAGISGYQHQPDDSAESRHEFELFTHMDELWEKAAFDELAELEVHVWADGPNQPLGRAAASIREYIGQVVRANYMRKDGKATPKTLEPPAIDRLGEIHVPTLVIAGEYDTTGTLQMADVLEKRIPNARKVIFPAVAHLLPMEIPQQFNQVVLDFLNSQV
jgi:pimeloyl-ACP methyl ester carboxylesterase